MMTYCLSKFFWLCIFLPVISYAHVSNVVIYNGYKINIDKQNPSLIKVVNELNGNISFCKINNRNTNYNTGMGVISLTSDDLAILVYSTNKYLIPDEIVSCNDEGVELHEIPNPPNPSLTIIDINFKKRLFLSLSLEDARERSYTAIISLFGSDKNLITGPSFYNANSYNYPFNTGTNRYVGKISRNGKYVSPYDLDCSVDAFPGVWDIKNNKKVVFATKYSGVEINNKCQKLFMGEETLQELDGKLITPKNDLQ